MVATSNTAFFSPDTVPPDPKDMRRFLTTQLARISAAVNLLAAGHIDLTSVSPGKPRNGDIRIADGVNWNPGSGEGPYWYNGAWVPYQANSKTIINNNASASVSVATNYLGFTGTNVATLTVNFPAASPTIDGMRITVFSQAAITTLTLASSGATFIAAPASLGANGITRFIYDHAGLLWLPI